MGSYVTTQNKVALSVSTLNYSGILNSPFQFYSAEMKQQEEALSAIFQNLMKKTFKGYDRETFKWGLGKIDQKMQKERYAVIYRSDCGVIGKRLITQQEEFNQVWNKQFDANVSKIEGLSYTLEEKERTCLFDWLCYQTILIHVLEGKDFIFADETTVHSYQAFIKKFYSKAFLNEVKKVLKTLTALDKKQTDIMFLQQANELLIDSIDRDKFKVIHSPKSESIILIRKSKFEIIHDEQKILNAMGIDVKNCLSWNNDTVIGFADNLILISGHLSSKKDKNSQQVQKMFQSLQRIKNIFPQRYFIVGCDANTCLKNTPQEFIVFPHNSNIKTTLKMRTMLQPQVSKAEILANQRRDYLITNLELINPKVISILGEEPQKIGYLPCQSHPYDHFVVTSFINPL